ncbi:MAG: HPr family phosphocarrier protein [Clostridia bacterium]|nr:HPr family phosphocarrier protein [Clostridia bacterium]
MLIKEIVLKKADGLNALNAALLVQLACKYSSSVMIRRGSVFINAKSMMGVLSLGAISGSALTFEIDGVDEKRAMKAITEFLSE